MYQIPLLFQSKEHIPRPYSYIGVFCPAVLLRYRICFKNNKTFTLRGFLCFLVDGHITKSVLKQNRKSRT